MEAFDFSYSIPYLLLALVYLLLFVYERMLNLQGKEITIVRILAIVIYVLFFGLRGHLMTDYINYYPMFNNLPGITSLYFWDEYVFINSSPFAMEPGFIIYTSIVKMIWPNYFFWIFVNTTITVFVLDWFFRRYSKYYALCFIVFFAFMGLKYEIDIFRNAKSLIFFLLSLPYLQRRKILPYFILNGIGFLFHSSSLFYFPLYFFVHLHYSRWIIWTTFVVGHVIFLFEIPIVRPLLEIFSRFISTRLAVLIEIYGGMEYAVSYKLTFGFFERMLTFIIFAIFYDRLAKENKANIIFCNLFFVYFITFCVCREITALITRIPTLFIMSYWVIYPNIISSFKIISNRVIYTGLLFAVCMMKIALTTNYIFLRYDNLLTGKIESYESRLQKFYYYKDEVLR